MKLEKPCSLWAAAVAAVAVAAAGSTTAQTIDTYAGNGVPGFSGDGGQAVDAQLQFPRQGLQVGLDGELYISDSVNNRIRHVDFSSGIITTIAGNGERGSITDVQEGPATDIPVGEPQGLALDGNRLLIAGLGRIRALDLVTDEIFRRGG